MDRFILLLLYMNTNKSNKGNKNIAPTKKIIRSISGKARTVKSRIPSRNNAIKALYNRDYYGTKLLPMTDVLNYIDANLNELVIAKNNNQINFDDFFVTSDILERKEKKADINIIIEQNPNMSLKKMLAYTLYLPTPGWFETGRLNISSFKSQIGKDASRVSIKINNEDYIIEHPPASESLDYYKVADDFNIKIMNVLSTFSVIDFDLVSKIDILMCQNLFNFIDSIITIMIMKKIQPEMSIPTAAEKDISINLTKNERTIIVNFTSRLAISNTGPDGLLNFEFGVTCGKLDLTLFIDLKRNTYKFTKFTLEYDIEECKPKSNNDQENGNQPENNNEENQGNSLLKYIPVGLGIGGIAATPFILGALGGKNKKLKTKKRKNKRRKRKNKTRKRKNTFIDS